MKEGLLYDYTHKRMTKKSKGQPTGYGYNLSHKEPLSLCLSHSDSGRMSHIKAENSSLVWMNPFKVAQHTRHTPMFAYKKSLSTESKRIEVEIGYYYPLDSMRKQVILGYTRDFASTAYYSYPAKYNRKLSDILHEQMTRKEIINNMKIDSVVYARKYGYRPILIYGRDEEDEYNNYENRVYYWD